jgi:hypothetical protein
LRHNVLCSINDGTDEFLSVDKAYMPFLLMNSGRSSEL